MKKTLTFLVAICLGLTLLTPAPAKADVDIFFPITAPFYAVGAILSLPFAILGSGYESPDYYYPDDSGYYYYPPAYYGGYFGYYGGYHRDYHGGYHRDFHGGNHRDFHGGFHRDFHGSNHNFGHYGGGHRR